MSVISGLVSRVQNLIARKRDADPEPSPSLNRKQRRALDRMKPGELRMRRERTYLAQAKRRTSSKGDHGAKAKRAYATGLQQGTEFALAKVQQAYVLGIEKGRADHQPWYSVIPGLKRKAAA